MVGENLTGMTKKDKGNPENTLDSRGTRGPEDQQQGTVAQRWLAGLSSCLISTTATFQSRLGARAISSESPPLPLDDIVKTLKGK